MVGTSSAYGAFTGEAEMNEARHGSARLWKHTRSDRTNESNIANITLNTVGLESRSAHPRSIPGDIWKRQSEGRTFTGKSTFRLAGRERREDKSGFDPCRTRATVDCLVSREPFPDRLSQLRGRVFRIDRIHCGQRTVFLRPSPNDGMVDGHTSFGHQFFDVTTSLCLLCFLWFLPSFLPSFLP
jgi:hypothetical protein